MVDPDDLRLQVTDRLRIACGYFAESAAMESLLISFETDRLQGFTWTASRLALLDQCQDDGCLRCGNELIDQIYGR